MPWEEPMDEANEWKHAKYQELVEEYRRQGWPTRCEPLEVGCRGFAGQSLCKAFALLGFTGEAKRKAISLATWAIAAGTQAGD